jgi:propionyl-CoA carboxylase beta chain
MNYAWPTAQIAVMGAKGEVGIILRSDVGDTEAIAARTKEYEDRFLSPFVAVERGYTSSCRTRRGGGSRWRWRCCATSMFEMSMKTHGNLPL